MIGVAKASAFKHFWEQQFGDVLPLGHELREALPNRWSRVHSLPGGKRYAETEAEDAVILERHVAIANAVLGAGEPCWLSACVFDHPGELTRDSTYSAVTELGLREAFTREFSASSHDERVSVRIFAGAAVWDAARFQKWLRAIANDELRLLWICMATGAVFAPYDGGADLILPMEADRSRVEAELQSWRSDRDDGL